MDNALHDILLKLAAAEPVEPRGWFRWLHNHYLGRYGFMHTDLTFDCLSKDEWREISDKPTPLYQRTDDQELLISFLNRHAWMAGMTPLIESVIACWSKLERSARGNFFAGLSEQHFSDKAIASALRHIHEMDFTPESLCQLACNSITYNRLDLLEMLLTTGTDITAEIRRVDASDRSLSWGPDILSQVSHRVIDMILEAALIQNKPDAARLALEHGADPDTPIWQLERSYNQKYSALGYTIYADNMTNSGSYRELAELLVEHGASAVGIPFSGTNHELFLAIGKGWDDLAERLISAGAQLSTPEEDSQTTPEIKTAGSESLVIGPGGPNFFGHFKEELNWAHTTIGSLIPLVPIAEKQAFFWSHPQGGQFTTILNKVVGNVERLKRYEALGLDTRLTAEEFCTAVDWNASEGLHYLLAKHGDDVCEQVFAAIRQQKPEFGQPKVK